MTDEQRFAELPSYSRMAWSSRPVWDRRPPVDKRRNNHTDLGMARRDRTHHRDCDGSMDRVHAMARSQSLVINGVLTRKETV